VFCPRCEKELPDDAQFCLKCGQALNATAPATVQPTKASHRVLWLLLPVLIVVVVWWVAKSPAGGTTTGSVPDKASTVPTPATSPPATASEVFHLRTECAHLGQKILEGNVIGVALTQDQVSHYDPQTNRCYVQLTVQTADLSKPTDYFSTYLYDGQTGEVLAYARVEHDKKSAIVFGLPPPDGQDPDRFWNQATDFINQKMEDDRKN